MKPTLPTYFCTVGMDIYQLPRISFLSGPGRSSHILSAKDEIRSVTKKTVLSFLVCSMLLFLTCGFFKNCNKSETISGVTNCFVLKIYVARVWEFFDVY